jgi:hypothetical protein
MSIILICVIGVDCFYIALLTHFNVVSSIPIGLRYTNFPISVVAINLGHFDCLLKVGCNVDPRPWILSKS